MEIAHHSVSNKASKCAETADLCRNRGSLHRLLHTPICLRDRAFRGSVQIVQFF